jgi:hypothetical protein
VSLYYRLACDGCGMESGLDNVPNPTDWFRGASYARGIRVAVDMCPDCLGPIGAAMSAEVRKTVTTEQLRPTPEQIR